MYSGASPKDTTHVVPFPVERKYSSSVCGGFSESKNPSLHASSYRACSSTISLAESLAMNPNAMQKSDARNVSALEYVGVSVGRIACISCCEHFVSVLF